MVRKKAKTRHNSIDYSSALSKLTKETSLDHNEILKFLKYRKQINQLADKYKLKEIDLIPIDIFSNRTLGALEALVKYLKETLNLKYSQIATLLKRNHRTIWTTYNKATKKHPHKLTFRKSKYTIPLTIFQTRQLGILELAVKYLKDEYSLSYSQIADILKRNQRTIWTAYNRKNES